jgi:hypothetical protein
MAAVEIEHRNLFKRSDASTIASRIRFAWPWAM